MLAVVLVTLGLKKMMTKVMIMMTKSVMPSRLINHQWVSKSWSSGTIIEPPKKNSRRCQWRTTERTAAGIILTGFGDDPHRARFWGDLGKRL